MLVWDEDNHLRLSRIIERTEPGQLLMVSDITFQILSDILPLSQSPGGEYVNLISWAVLRGEITYVNIFESIPNDHNDIVARSLPHDLIPTLPITPHGGVPRRP